MGHPLGYFTKSAQKILVTKCNKPHHLFIEGPHFGIQIFWEKTVKRFLSLIAIFLLPCGLFGQSVTMEDKVVTQAGRMASVTIKSDGKATNWVVVPPENIDIFREYDPDPGVIKLRLLSYSNGTFFIVANTTLNDKLATKTCVVQVGVAPPPIPVPPGPPVPPDVDAQLIRNLKAVYAADSSPNKEHELEALTALYDQGAVFVKTRADLKTYGQVWDSFAQVAKTLGCSQKLLAVQQLIRNEMQTNGIPINAADGAMPVDKAKLVPQLTRIANLLRQVK